MALNAATLLPGPRVALVLNKRDVDALNAELGITGDPNAPSWDDMGSSAGLTWHSGVDDQPFWVVGLSPDLDVGQVIGTLVHESVHVWQEYKIVIAEAEPSREFEAYSIEGIFTELMRQFGESREGRRRIKAG